MSVYLDASVLVPLFVLDPLNARAVRAFGKIDDVVVVSDFAAAEFASVIALRVRIKDLSAAEARKVFATFDDWIAARAERAEIAPSDVLRCAAYLRRLDLPLRAPDALHVAIAGRLAARLLTFDAKLRGAALKLGLDAVV